MVELIDDEYANVRLAGLIFCSPTSLVFLVGDHRRQSPARLPDRPAGKNIALAYSAPHDAKGQRVTAHPLSVVEVCSRTERDQFIKFPWRIYKNDPAWVPPLIIERKAFLDRKRHPFYQHGDAALFLAKRNGEIVGRIMVSDDPNYNALHRSDVGCFGLFESTDDIDVAAALFDRAAEWLRRRGRSEIMGPIDYSTNYVCGLLIDGFQFPPTILTAHNPPYYQQLIESCAFATTGRTFSKALAGHDPAWKSQEYSRGKQAAPPDLQSSLGKELGFCAVHRSGVRVHDARAQAARHSGFHAHRGSRRRAGWLHSMCAGHQHCPASYQWPAYDFRIANRPYKTSLLQEPHANREAYRAWRDRKISAYRHCRNACPADRRRRNDQAWIHGRTRSHARR